MCMIERIIKAVKSLLSPDGKVSSKRLAGLTGLFVIFGCFIYCTIKAIQMPECTEFLTGSCVTLLGIDPIVSTFKNKEDNESKQYTDRETEEL